MEEHAKMYEIKKKKIKDRKIKTDVLFHAEEPAKDVHIHCTADLSGGLLYLHYILSGLPGWHFYANFLKFGIF